MTGAVPPGDLWHPVFLTEPVFDEARHGLVGGGSVPARVKDVVHHRRP